MVSVLDNKEWPLNRLVTLSLKQLCYKKDIVMLVFKKKIISSLYTLYEVNAAFKSKKQTLMTVCVAVDHHNVIIIIVISRDKTLLMIILIMQ